MAINPDVYEYVNPDDNMNPPPLDLLLADRVPLEGRVRLGCEGRHGEAQVQVAAFTAGAFHWAVLV